jgi:hypothetical protein
MKNNATAVLYAGKFYVPQSPDLPSKARTRAGIKKARKAKAESK